MCKKSLLLTPEEPFEKIHPDAFAHPLDRAALTALRKIPGLKTILGRLFKESFERSERMRHFASYVRINQAQIPAVYKIYEMAARRLDIQPIPDLFIFQSPMPNAYTLGVREPIIAVSTSLVDLLEEKELLGILSHELAHWASDHALYKMAVRFIVVLGTQLASSFLGLGALAVIPIQMALLEWDRCSELTADRAELLSTGDLTCHLRTLMKLASGSHKIYNQMSVEAFIDQAKVFRQMEGENALNKLASLLQTVNRSHPYPIWRAFHLIEWSETEDFFNIMAGHYKRTDQSDTAQKEPSQVNPDGKQKEGVAEDFIDKAKKFLDGDTE
jgi:Zn-dependent protease with chaperone function